MARASSSSGVMTALRSGPRNRSRLCSQPSGTVNFVAQEARRRKAQFEQSLANLAPFFGVALAQFTEHGSPLLRLDQFLATGFEFGLGLLSPTSVRFEIGRHPLGGPGLGGQGDFQGFDLGSDRLDFDIDGLECIPAAVEDLFGAVAAVDGLLAADALGDQCSAQFALPRPAGGELAKEQALALAGFRNRGVGVADAPAVLLHVGQGLLALGLEHPAPAEETGEPFFGRREVAPPPLRRSRRRIRAVRRSPRGWCGRP